MKLGPYGMAPSSYEMSQCVAKASCLVGVGVGIVGVLVVAVCGIVRMRCVCLFS